jgi:site-specific DNA-methyltransferase (adenine-specific)
MTELRIETVNINSLTPDPANARKHDGKNLKAIASSLEKFGQRKPIVVTPDSIVVAGNGTVEAAKSLGWTEIAIARTPIGWTWDQIKAFALADNRTAELAEWDDKVLADQLLELDANGWELEELGFENLEPPISDEDDEPLSFDDAPTRAKLGDIWKLGNHRLMCGDSTDKSTVAKLLNGIKADMAFTDPPYGVSYTGGLQFKDGVVEKNNREMIENDDIDLYADVFPVLADFVNGACYIWFAGTKASNLYTAAEKFGTIHALIIWVKNGGYGALNANYKQKHEPCLYWKPKNANLNFVGQTTETTVWNIDKDGINKLHPTQKPIALAMKAIQNHTAKTVLDLFGGSGSTLIACEKTNRSCFMMELDPKYADVIIKRWEDLTGKTAELVEE